MAPKLYGAPGSPLTRGDLMIAKHIGLELELIFTMSMTSDTRTPEYLKMNPQHTIPTMDDDGFILTDSHAIAAYFVEKYAKDDSLYPKDIQKRAVINQRLHFNNGVLFLRLRTAVAPVFFEGKEPEEKESEPLIEALGFLEAFLQNGEYIAGDGVSIADYCIIATVTTIGLVVPIDSSKFPRLAEWFKKMEAWPAYETNKEGLETFKSYVLKK